MIKSDLSIYEVARQCRSLLSTIPAFESSQVCLYLDEGGSLRSSSVDENALYPASYEGCVFVIKPHGLDLSQWVSSGVSLQAAFDGNFFSADSLDKLESLVVELLRIFAGTAFSFRPPTGDVLPSLLLDAGYRENRLESAEGMDIVFVGRLLFNSIDVGMNQFITAYQLHDMRFLVAWRDGDRSDLDSDLNKVFFDRHVIYNNQSDLVASIPLVPEVKKALAKFSIETTLRI